MNTVARVAENNDWITLMLIGVVCLVWTIKSVYYHRFMEFLQLPFNNRYFASILKEKNLESSFTMLMLIVQVVSFSLFVWLAVKTFHYKVFEVTTTLVYWKLLLATFLFIATKIVLQVLIASVFDIQNNTNEFLYRKLSYLNYSSLFILVGVAFGVYSKNLSNIALYVSFFMAFLINVVGWMGILKNYQKFILKHLFYFILYLCTFEIAPWLIIGSYVTTK